MKKLLKISELEFDSEIYPRMKVGWQTAYQYAQAMKAGSEFPAILVGTLNRKYHVIDGWHRIEALKMLKEENVPAIIKEFKTKKEMFVEAVRVNSKHGRQLSVQEKARIIHKLGKLKFSLKEISKIVKVPLDKIEIFKARTIIGPNGTPVYQKSVTAKAGITEPIDQESFNVRSVKHLLVQLVELLECDSFQFDEDVKGLAARTYSLLGEKLELVVEAS